MQRQNNALLDYLQRENAKALRSIQEENSTFIMQHQTEGSLDLTSMERGAADRTMLTVTQQDASHHIVPFQQSPTGESEPRQYSPGSQTCDNCHRVEQMNEALADENDRLRRRLESMLDLLQQFEEERQLLRQSNDAKIDGMERKVELMREDKGRAHSMAQRDHHETVRCLKEHIRQLEHANFQNEISAVNMSNMTLLTHGNTSKEVDLSGAQKRGDADQKDELWQARVGFLERQLAETRDFYLQKMTTLQRDGKVSLEDMHSLKLSRGTSANGRCNVALTDQTLDDMQGQVLHTQSDHHEASQQQYASEPYPMTFQSVGLAGSADGDGLDKQMLVEKLAYAEQDLDQLTRELESLRRENSFLAKLNKQVTSHAFKHESKKLDLRRHNAFGDAQAICLFTVEAFKDPQLFTLIDLRHSVVFACTLAQSSDFTSVLAKDQLFQVMEDIVSKLQRLSVTNQNQSCNSFEESIMHADRSQFDEFLESCIELC